MTSRYLLPAVCLLLAARVASQAAAPLPPSALAVRAGGRWTTWWRAEKAPARWARGDDVLARAIAWRPGAAGVAWGELELAGSGEAWRTRVVVARLDPARVRLRLDTGFARGMRADWSLDRAPRGAVLAVNAGQFADALPWGWVVLDGRQFLAAGRGPMAPAVVVDTAGQARWVRGDSVAALARAASRAGGPRGAGIAWAFQSYPALLDGGEVPAALRAAAGGVDVAHRDGRLALCRLADGGLLVALTRFDGAGAALGPVPLGLTVPEMAAVAGALGCRDAVLLDGGISAQMLLRDGAGAAHAWRGVRRVPLALVALPR